MARRKEKEPIEKKRPHWIIRSKKKNAIWLQVFNSFDEAKAEFDYQMSKLTQEIRENVDWRIEKRIPIGYVEEEKREGEKEDDGFGGF